MDLNVEIKGKGFPIVCLHGHPGDSGCLSVFTDHLCQRFKTIAPDLRGYGKSHKQGSYEIGAHVLDLEQLLDKLAIKRCLLLGWSLGGIIALELLLKNPNRFSGLILIASAANPKSTHPRVTRLELLFTGIAGVINYLKPGWQWNIEVFGKRSLFRYLFAQQTPLAYKYLAQEGTRAYLRTSRAAERALSEALKLRYNRLELLKNINCPCLVLAGEQDRHIAAFSSHETARQLVQSQWQCYPDTAHLFPWEIPNQVLRDIDSWLSANPSVLMEE